MHKFTRSLSLFAAALCAMALGWGCATAPTAADFSNALVFMSQATAQGLATYQQIQELKELAKVEAASCDDAAPGFDPAAPLPTEPPQLAASGYAVAAVLGNRDTCGYCVRLWKTGLEAEVETALPGVDVIDADVITDPAAYARYRPASGFAYPLVRVWDATVVFRGEFVARGMSAQKVAAEISALCPECAEAPAAPRTEPWITSKSAAAVVVNLTQVDPRAYRGWAGDCPGTDVDASVFGLMCEAAKVPYVHLANSQATRQNIVNHARRAAASLQPGGLLTLYFSGHGGQVSQAVAGNEADGKDETLCLWDGPLRDDDVWTLLTQLPPGIRVWMITDSCNSGTNYRGVHDYVGAVAARVARTGTAVSLLHWGGCGDGQYSYGSAQGGHFTTALVDAWQPGQSYAAWFTGAQAATPASQVPTCDALDTATEWRQFPAFQ